MGSGRLTDGISRHRVMFVVYLSVPFGAAAFWWFSREGLLSLSYWFVATMLVATAGLNLASYLWLHAGADSTPRLQARLAVSALTTTAVIYATGWGPMLVVAYGVGSAAIVQEAGSRSWRPGLVWAAVGIAAGEVAIGLGWAPSVVGATTAHAIAISGLACLAIVVRVLGLTSSAAEAAEARLSHDALHDPLTGLWNRGAFMQFADNARARGARSGSTLAILFIDLDGFKQVNDRVGHDLGDHVLVEIAGRIRACLRTGDVLARLGGDEFTALLESVAGPAAAIEAAERIIAAVARPSALFSGATAVGASVGIVLDRGGARGVGDCLRDADTAMYRAKRGGGSAWELGGPGPGRDDDPGPPLRAGSDVASTPTREPDH